MPLKIKTTTVAQNTPIAFKNKSTTYSNVYFVQSRNDICWIGLTGITIAFEYGGGTNTQTVSTTVRCSQLEFRYFPYGGYISVKSSFESSASVTQFSDISSTTFKKTYTYTTGKGYTPPDIYVEICIYLNSAKTRYVTWNNSGSILTPSTTYTFKPTA